jgi:nucleotidyltransferase substrate binding protein (TIGR01987 family)
MTNIDIRWRQRFSNYKKALEQLEKFTSKGLNLSDMEEQGLIKSFECTYELGWATLKDYFEDQGHTDITGSKDAIKRAFKVGVIGDGDALT